jgi:hypothetical protein
LHWCIWYSYLIQGGKDEAGNFYPDLYYYRYNPSSLFLFNFTKIPLQNELSQGFVVGAVQSYAVFWGVADPTILYVLDTNKMTWSALIIKIGLQYGTITGCGDFLVLSGNKSICTYSLILPLGFLNSNYTVATYSFIYEDWTYYTFPTQFSTYDSIKVATAGTFVLYFGPNGTVVLFDTLQTKFSIATINDHQTGGSVFNSDIYAFYAGGAIDVIDAFDSINFKWTTINMGSVRSQMGATSVSNMIILGGNIWTFLFHFLAFSTSFNLH